MPQFANQNDILARYIYFSRFIKTSNRTVRYAAFLPSSIDNKTSVFKITGLSENDIWDIANTHVTPMQNNTLKGRADIGSEDVISQGLDLIPDEHPDRHLNITGWSNDKSKNQLIAQELVKKAILYLVP